jgi:hypothetical protein
MWANTTILIRDSPINGRMLLYKSGAKNLNHYLALSHDLMIRFQ